MTTSDIESTWSAEPHMKRDRRSSKRKEVLRKGRDAGRLKSDYIINIKENAA
jgi:hypothetical protein